MRVARRRALVGAGLAAVAAAAGTLVVAAPAQAASCGVSGGLLWCGNDVAPMMDKPSTNLPEAHQVDTLRTRYSYFRCWSEGQIHAGGNYTWYKTEGDDHGRTGWVAASYVYTASSFDANPSAHGLPKCQYNFG